MITEGYAKYRGAAFKIPGVSNWIVVVSGPRFIDELRKAPDDCVSFRAAAKDACIFLQIMYTMGPEVFYSSYHVEVVRSPLTRNLVARFPDVQDEIQSAFKEYIPQTEDWTAISALSTIRKIVSRSSNRLFVGLPLCRNDDYRDLNIEFAIDVLKTAQIINLFPNFLKPFVGRCFSNVELHIQRAMGHLRPFIQERLDNEAQYGKDWPGRPNDALSWLLDHAEEYQKTVRELTTRILVVNFAAIHTTSQAFTQVLFDLAANPSLVPALREEVETVILEEGYSKLSLHKMVKLDSFIKESQRLGANNALIMQRKVLKDFTFSDGTVVPKGHIIAVPNFAMHYDEENYVDASVFDGFRFSKMRELQAEGHACPGRFFAVNELKALLAYTLLNYDVSFEHHGSRPANSAFNTRISANPKASVLFRKRRP
ncbi:Ent-kaurene oxidase [Termitomyces sp. J132]|nr:Ent-kaurene oxidase [Termitomyces sp. J132]